MELEGEPWNRQGGWKNTWENQGVGNVHVKKQLRQDERGVKRAVITYCFSIWSDADPLSIKKIFPSPSSPLKMKTYPSNCSLRYSLRTSRLVKVFCWVLWVALICTFSLIYKARKCRASMNCFVPLCFCENRFSGAYSPGLIVPVQTKPALWKQAHMPFYISFTK